MQPCLETAFRTVRQSLKTRVCVVPTEACVGSCRQHCIWKKKIKENIQSRLRLLGPVAPVVDRGGHTHDHSGEEISRHVEIPPAWIFALKDLHQHQIELNPLQTHPSERRQEKVMENSCDYGAGHLRNKGEGQEQMRSKESFSKWGLKHTWQLRDVIFTLGLYSFERLFFHKGFDLITLKMSSGTTE